MSREALHAQIKELDGYESWMDAFITTVSTKVLGVGRFVLYHCWDESQANIIKITSDPHDAINALKEHAIHLNSNESTQC